MSGIIPFLTGRDIRKVEGTSDIRVAGVDGSLGLPPSALSVSPYFKSAIAKYSNIPVQVTRQQAVEETQKAAEMQMQNVYRTQFIKARTKAVREAAKAHQATASFAQQMMQVDNQLQQVDAQTYLAAQRHGFTTETNEVQITGWQRAKEAASSVWS